MTDARWSAVDDYLDALYIGTDDALDATLAATSDAGLPWIQVSATQGKLLHLLARTMRARTALEVGTLAGYSTIWLARALPSDGRVVTCEIDPRHAAVAQDNIDRAGLHNVVDIRVGPALDTLAALAAATVDPFDLVFIDADKENNPHYLELALALTRPGSLVVVDNVIRDGAVLDASSTDPSVVGTRRLHEMLASDPRVSATAVQTVGNKGYDGSAVAVVV